MIGQLKIEDDVFVALQNLARIADCKALIDSHLQSKNPTKVVDTINLICD